MKRNHQWTSILALLCSALSQRSFADCVIAEQSKQLDPVEVGFCESDAVFIGKSEGAIESIGGVTPEGSTVTKHFRIQRSTIHVVEQFKGALPNKVTLIADLYAKDSYVFEAGRTYLIFAKHLAGENEYAGAGACSVQPTLPIDDAKKVLTQLAQNKNGRKAINCKNIRAKDQS